MVLLVLVLALAQTPDTVAPATVRGRVTDATTGEPIRMARVHLNGPGPTGVQVQRRTRTDVDGEYEFREVTPGAVSVMVIKARYVPAQYGETAPGRGFKRITVAPGAVVENIDLALSPASAITGRIVDDLSDPIEGAMVQAMVPGVVNGRRTLRRVGNAAATDDAGEYRIPQLQPGSYFVVARERSGGFGSDLDTDIGLLPTAYPAAGTMADARRVAVKPGVDTTGVDIALLPARTSKVTGRVLSSAGTPVGGVTLVLSDLDEGPGAGTGSGETRSLPDGTFTIPRVVHGRYELHARHNVRPNEGAVVPLTVAGDMDIVVPLTRGGRIIGRIVPPEGFTRKPPELVVHAVPTNPGVFGTGFGGHINDDWTFDWDFLLEDRIIRATTKPKGWILQSVTRADEDITDKPIVFNRAEVVDDVVVTFTTVATQVSGIVVDNSGQPATLYTVVAFADDKSKWSPWSRFIVTARPDEQGKFSLAELPPAKYRIIALDAVDDGEWFDPEFLEKLRARAQAVTLEPGDSPELRLTLTKR